MTLDETHDPARRSWVQSANDGRTDFPIQNLPLGVFAPREGGPRAGVAIGDRIFDIAAARAAGLFAGDAERAAAAAGPTLNAMLALGPEVLRAFRHRVADLLDAKGRDRAAAEAVTGLLHAAADCTMLLPSAIGDYTDFYAGIHHARAAGALMLPNADDPLPPNYKWLPIAYHGRASSVRASGGEVRRPLGQFRPQADRDPVFGPCERLDIELELGFFIGGGNRLGADIPIGQASRHIVGFCLLNDWSARDIQRWEMAPLGPFNGKNFSTTISPWIVTADALAPFRAPAMERPDGDPKPLAYLADEHDQANGGIDINLEVWFSSAQMRSRAMADQLVIHSNARYLYWTPAQMVAHHAAGGCNLSPGDLIGTGTISGPTRDELSSFLELTRAGADPFRLPTGETRGFLNDGDEVTLKARCVRESFVSIGFGECRGRILPA